jgi:hypothetical protein
VHEQGDSNQGFQLDEYPWGKKEKWRQDRELCPMISDYLFDFLAMSSSRKKAAKAPTITAHTIKKT